MRTEIMTITPEIAGDWLAINTHNRRMKDRWVSELAGRISRDEWRLNGEPIIISEAGVLIDGQHRLAAIIMANKPIESVVTFDAPEESYETVDTGRARQFQDTLYVNRETNYARLAAMLAWEYRLDHGVMHRVLVNPSHAELAETLEKHPELREAAARGHEVAKASRLMPDSLAAWLYHKFGAFDEVKAQSFFASLIDGANLPPGSPILALRERLIANRTSPSKLVKSHLAALVIKAWNAYLAGHELLICSWRSDEAYPVIGHVPTDAARSRVLRTLARKE